MLAFAALLAIVPLVAAQDTASAAASAAALIPSCALTCTIQNAGSSTCGGIGNVTCLCSDSAFQSSVFNCYTAQCSESELQSAIQYGYGICQTVGITLQTTAIPSGATATRASGGNSTAAGSSSAASSSATSSGAGSTTPAPTSSTAAQTTASSSGTAAPASASPTGAAERFAVPAVAVIAGFAGLAALLL